MVLASPTRDSNRMSVSMGMEIINLKPLRDLAQNFDLDIAHSLQEYLDELQQQQEHPPSQLTQITQEEDLRDVLDRSKMSQTSSTMIGLTGTNFTQGALLLQNSSCVYSRKVDYFHTLVYEALHSLKLNDKDHQSRARQRKSNFGAGMKKVDPDVEDFFAFDSELNFLCFGENDLPLDMNGTMINLDEKDRHEDSDNREKMDMTMGTSTPNPTETPNQEPPVSGHSIGGMMSITRLGLDQTMLQNATHNTQSIKSHAAQALLRNLLNENNRLIATAAGGDPSQGTLRLMSGVCDVEAETGGLLMPGTGAGFATHSDDDQNDEAGNGKDENVNQNGDDEQIPSTQRLDMSAEDIEAVDFDQGYGDEYDNGDNEGGEGEGFILNSPHNTAGQEYTEQITQPEHRKVQEVEENEKEKDPWLMLDPHDDSKAKFRPLRQGTTFCLPYEIELPPSESVTGATSSTSSSNIDRCHSSDEEEGDSNCNARKRRKKKKHFPRAKKPVEDNVIDYTHGLYQDRMVVKEYTNILAFATEAKEKQLSLEHCDGIENKDDDSESDGDIEMLPATDKTCKMNTQRKMEPMLPMKELIFGQEFLYIAKLQAKHKATERRRLRRAQMDKAAASKSAIAMNERFRDMYHDDYEDDNDDGPAFDFAGVDDDYAGGDDDRGDGNDNLNIFKNQRDSSESQMFNGVFDDGRDGNGDNKKTFEELCRAHLKEFAKGADKFAYETQLSRRVAKWQSKIAVILEEEDERNDFDIQRYGNNILDDVEKSLKRKSVEGANSSNDAIKFVSITCHQEPYQVCRTFLASLMLCNNENMIFCGEGEHGISSPNDLRLKMLNAKLDSPMENYLAPSAAEKMIKT